jgi:hypothetical protein
VLRGLDLSATGLQAAGLGSLARLDRLAELGLGRLTLDEAIVPVIARLPRLRQLDLTGATTTPAVVSRLRRPRLIIVGPSAAAASR